jgi:predicted metal-binding protein
VSRPTVAICRTCPRDTARATACGANPDGMAVQLRSALLADCHLTGEIDIMMVHCLGACPRPCAAALSAPGKWRLRFEGLSPSVLSDFVAATKVYSATGDGLLGDRGLSPSLRERLGARAPPPAAPQRTL